MVYTLLTKKMGGVPTNPTKNNSQRDRRDLFPCPGQWNPCFSLTWQTSRRLQKDSTGDSHTNEESPTSLFNMITGPSRAKINRLLGGEEGLS